jgi:hypothetical protein
MDSGAEIESYALTKGARQRGMQVGEWLTRKGEVSLEGTVAPRAGSKLFLMRALAPSASRAVSHTCPCAGGSPPDMNASSHPTLRQGQLNSPPPLLGPTTSPASCPHLQWHTRGCASAALSTALLVVHLFDPMGL